MIRRFANRREAGRCLAKSLERIRSLPGLLVLALPRGGVPVAREVARSLGAPLDVLTVRKLGVPGHEELALGAIASGGVRVVNPDVVDALGLSEDAIDRIAAREASELARRESAYRQRDGRPLPPLDVRGRTVVIVDDGLATGSTMMAAVKALSIVGPDRIIVAIPVGPPDTIRRLATLADEVVCCEQPEPFFGVGLWYDDFSQVSDREVQEALDTP